MIKSLEIRNAAFRLADQKFVEGKPTYGLYSPIYIASTSNVTDTMKLYKDYESVLTVGGTGAHAYEALLNGAKHVDLFDINELQRLYFEYMKTAITYLDYPTFIKHFTLPKQTTVMKRENLKDLLSNDLYQKLYFFLPDEVEEVFSPLFDFHYSVDLVISNLFRFEHIITLDHLKKNVSFYNEEEYYKLQTILRDENYPMDFKTVPLTDVPKAFKEKYDLIILDNILQYYKDIRGLETPYAVNMFISKQLSSLLKEDGTIQVNYGFEVATDAVKERFKIPYTKSCVPMIDFILKTEQKTGINIPLIEKWSDRYSYEFIPGVERTETPGKENLILNYKRK